MVKEGAYPEDHTRIEVMNSTSAPMFDRLKTVLAIQFHSLDSKQRQIFALSKTRDRIHGPRYALKKSC